MKYFDDDTVGKGFALVELDTEGMVCAAMGPYALADMIRMRSFLDVAISEIANQVERQIAIRKGDC